MKTCLLKSVIAVAVTGLFSFAAWAEETEDKTDYTLSGATNITVAAGDILTMSGKLTGTGSISKRGLGTLVLNNGENDFEGGVTVYEGYLRIDREGCLGSGKLRVDNDGYNASTSPRQAIFNAPNATFANAVDVTDAAASTSDSCSTVLVKANTTLSGRVFGQSNASYIRVDSGVKLTLTGTLTVYGKRSMTFYNYGTVLLQGTVSACGSVWAGGASSTTGTLELDTDGLDADFLQTWSGKVVCKRENAFAGAGLGVRVRSASSTGSFDLGGFDQECTSFTCYDPNGETKATTTGFEIKSTGSATLTVVGTGAGNSTTCMFAVNDQVSVNLDADQSFALNFSKRTHGTTGTLQVSSGIINVNDTSTFKKATKVVVGTDGVFNLNSTETGALVGVTEMTVDGEFHSTATAPFATETMKLSLGNGSAFDLGGEIRVKELYVRGEPVDAGSYTHDDYDEIAEGTTIYTQIPKTTDSWTGAGADASLETAENWQKGKSPNLRDGGFSPVFSTTGARAEIAAPVTFDNLSFIGSGFTLAGADESAKVSLLGALTIADDPDGATRTFDVDVPVILAADQSWYLQEHTTLKLCDISTTGSITKAGPGTFELSGSNEVDGVLSIARNVNRLSGVITTTHGPDLSDVTASNSVRYNESGDGSTDVYGKLYLDNVTIRKPFYTSTHTASSHADTTLMAAAMTTNRIEGAWKANGELWQGFKQDAKSVLYVDNGMTGLYYFKFTGGTVHIRNKPVVHTALNRELAVASETTLWLEAADNKVGKFVVGGKAVTTVDGALSEGQVTLNAKAVLDLQGTTQRIEKVTANAGARIVGTEGSNLELGTEEDFSLDCDLADMVSIRKTGAGTMTLAARAFATTGTVAVAEGTLATSVGTKLARRATLSLEGTGVLSVPSGSTIRVHAMKVDGVDLQPGTYSYAKIADERIRRHFDPATTGVVNVTGDGIVIFVR